MKPLVPLLLCPTLALADASYTAVSGPWDDHQYTGDWTHFIGGGVAVLDCDGDTLPELFVAGGARPAALFKNAGDFKFETADLPPLTSVTGAYPIDANADGHLDLFVMRVGPNVLLTGDGACGFVDGTTSLGLPAGDAWTTAFSAWLAPGDTRPTMAIGNYVDQTNPDGPFEACDDNQILRPTDSGWTAETLSPGFCPLSMLAAADARGRPTLRISNDRHYYVRQGFEQMFDLTDQRFLDETDGWARVSLWGMGIASTDLTGDERDEVMLTSMGDQVLQLAQSDGTYKPARFDIGTYAQRPHLGDDGRPSTGWHAEFGDVDNDGRPDLFIAKGNVDQMPGNAMEDPNNLLMQNPDGRFDEQSVAAGVATTARSRGAALADLDGDGRLDLVIVNRRAAVEVYRNETEDTGNWIKIALPHSALGSRVTVVANDQILSQQFTIGGGHASGDATPLHFGIGTASSVILRVSQPDGTVTTQTTSANQTVHY